MARVPGVFDRFRESSDKRERIEGVGLKPLWTLGCTKPVKGDLTNGRAHKEWKFH
jgi:hypothetical protein